MLYSCKIKIKPTYEILSPRAVCLGVGGKGEGSALGALVDEQASGNSAGRVAELPCHRQGHK